MPTSYIAYYRVSTQRQGQSGLGLEAQRASTASFLASGEDKLISEYTEVESGKRSSRPELENAIEACRKLGAVLLIAKLDRLARNVHFISGLLESGVRFTAVDMPNADRFMLHVYAAMAEEEGRRISERTKSALAAAKVRGVRLGVNGANLANQRKQTANAFAREIGPTKIQLHEYDGLSYSDVADRLNQSGKQSFAGKRWHSTSVYRTESRFRAIQQNSL